MSISKYVSFYSSLFQLKTGQFNDFVPPPHVFSSLYPLKSLGLRSSLGPINRCLPSDNLLSPPTQSALLHTILLNSPSTSPKLLLQLLLCLMLFVAAAPSNNDTGQPYKDWVFINYTFKRFEGLTHRGPPIKLAKDVVQPPKWDGPSGSIYHKHPSSLQPVSRPKDHLHFTRLSRLASF